MDQRMMEKLAEVFGHNGPQDPAKRKAQQLRAFSATLDNALDDACPNAADPIHARLDAACLEMLKASVDMAELVPSSVAEAVFKLAAHKMTHSGEDATDVFKGLLNGGLADAFLIAGATLRVIERANKDGIALSTGNYL